MSLSTETLTKKELRAYLRERIIPEVEKQSPIILSGMPPFHEVAGVRIATRSLPLLRNVKPSGGFNQAEHWPAEGLNASRFPCLIIVLEGEADMEFGVTRRMAAQNPALGKESSRFIITLPALSSVIVPPRQPISDASRPHWDRSRAQPADSRLLWAHFIPSGVSLHICISRGDQHASTRSFFIGDLQIHALMELLLDEMPSAGKCSASLRRMYLCSIFLRIDRGLATRALESTSHESSSYGERQVGEENLPSSAKAPVQRACRFIDLHLNETLTVSQIAAHAYISVPHLHRLFQAQKKTTIMQYVTQQRLTRAKILLRETDLPIQRIAEVVGYRHPEHFSRAFHQSIGSSPTVFRRRKMENR